MATHAGQAPTAIKSNQRQEAAAAAAAGRRGSSTTPRAGNERAGAGAPLSAPPGIPPLPLGRTKREQLSPRGPPNGGTGSLPPGPGFNAPTVAASSAQPLPTATPPRHLPEAVDLLTQITSQAANSLRAALDRKFGIGTTNSPHRKKARANNDMEDEEDDEVVEGVSQTQAYYGGPGAGDEPVSSDLVKQMLLASQEASVLAIGQVVTKRFDCLQQGLDGVKKSCDDNVQKLGCVDDMIKEFEVKFEKHDGEKADQDRKFAEMNDKLRHLEGQLQKAMEQKPAPTSPGSTRSGISLGSSASHSPPVHLRSSAVLGDLGWNTSDQLIRERALQTLKQAGVPESSISAMSPMCRPGGVGSSAEVHFASRQALDVARSMVRSLNLTHPEARRPCWLDVQRSAEERRPGRLIKSAVDALGGVASIAEDRLQWNVKMRSIKIDGALAMMITGTEIIWKDAGLKAVEDSKLRDVINDIILSTS